MDYLGEGIAIAINGVVFTYVLKQFLRRQHAVSMVQVIKTFSTIFIITPHLFDFSYYTVIRSLIYLMYLLLLGRSSAGNQQGVERHCRHTSRQETQLCRSQRCYCSNWQAYPKCQQQRYRRCYTVDQNSGTCGAKIISWFLVGS